MKSKVVLPISTSDFRARAKARLSFPSFTADGYDTRAGLPDSQRLQVQSNEPGPGPGDDDLNPDALNRFERGTGEPGVAALKPAAVLIGVVDNAALDVYFTLRTSHLPTHAGQISFPGGKVDANDPGPAEAALREAEEEIGLTTRFVEPLGFLETYRTGTGYTIQPMVGLIDPKFIPEPNPSEVAELFTVPLNFLMDSTRMDIHARSINGRERRYYAVTYDDRFIWGATAGILKNMRERLFG
ncbi:MAG: CoA pyrophosphatase [Pseudomonadota bacterium]